jgi:hypothetical protein
MDERDHLEELGVNRKIFFFSIAQQPTVGQGLLIFTITLRHTTLGRSPLDE